MIVAEPVIVGDEHVAVNAGLVWAATVASRAPVQFWAEPHHYALLRALLPPDVAERVAFEPLAPPPRRMPVRPRFRHDLRTAWSVVRRAATMGESHVMLSCALPGTLIGAKLALLSMRPTRRPRVDAVVHSSLEEVWGWRSRRPLNRLRDMTGSLELPAPREFRIVVLEKGIARALAAKLPRVARHLHVIDFPIVQTVEPASPRRPGPPRVGFLGRANREKGFDRFCRLAHDVRSRGADIEFHSVGHASPGSIDNDALGALATAPAHDLLDRADFLARVADLDIVVILHDPAHYSHTASGVLLDAIAAARPVLSVANPGADALAAQHGSIGPQVVSLDSAADFLATLSIGSLDGPDFRAWRQNVRAIAASRHPEAVGIAYHDALRT